MLKLVSSVESYSEEITVKELVRHKLFGLDSVAGESANAFNDYIVLNKFLKNIITNMRIMINSIKK